MGIQNILDNNGFWLAITGMGIVFFVLIVVSLFLFSLPKLLPIVNNILPVIEHHHGAPMPSAAPAPIAAPDKDTVAAIGFTLHHRKTEG